MDTGKVNILIVDDKPEQLIAIEAVLEDLHQNVSRAYSGREALRAVLQSEFAVILLDVNMPGMDGFETAQLIRQRQSTQHVPIIFVTASGDENHLARGYSLGAVDYIQTPVVPEVLRTKVKVFVELFAKTEQVRQQARSLRRRAEQLQKLAAASAAINSALSIEKLLQTITDVARDVVGAHQAITLFILGSGSSKQSPRTVSATSFSDKLGEWRGRCPSLDRVATTIVAQSRVPTRLTRGEFQQHTDFEILRELEIPRIEGGLLAAPLSGRDGTNLGVIYLADRIEADFTDDDEALLVQVAQLASIAIENTLFAEERETNRIKDEFLSTLSHELRTPLGAILGWTHLLKSENLGQSASQGVEVIERCARAQARLIEDMLDVSRIATGKLKIHTKPVQVSGVIKAAVDAAQPAAAEKLITISSALANGDELIVADPDRLHQVVGNLLSNAVKFTQAGGQVDVEMHRTDQWMRIIIRDNGPGIHPRFLPHVFDRFKQADSSSTRQHGGLGIGLAIVRHIIELHGGRVRAESAGEGMGATFTIELPASASEGLTLTPAKFPRELDIDVLPPSARNHSSGNGIGTDLAGVRVLLIDDEPDTLQVIARLFRCAGASVEAASSVDDALSKIDRQRPEVLVSDIAMPQKDGYDLIRELRAGPNADIPVLALTAYAREEDRARALAAGFQDHLAKPVDPAKILAAVRNLAKNNHRPGIAPLQTIPTAAQS